VNKFKIDLDTAYIILNIINKDYNTSYQIEDVFNTEMIKDYTNEDEELKVSFVNIETSIYDYSSLFKNLKQLK
jgi:hypothetical protein